MLRKVGFGALSAAALSCATGALAAGGTGWFTVQQVVVEGGRVYLYADNILNPTACQTSAYVMIDAHVPQIDHFLSVALTAASTGKPVQAWIAGCAPSVWHSSAPSIVSLVYKP